MNCNGPILIIDDDTDDMDILKEVFQDLQYPNEIFFFSEGQKAIDFLSNTRVTPFLILSDINMPKLNGFAVRDEIYANGHSSLKLVPYLFFTTSSSHQSIIDTLNCTAQGLFIKPNSIADYEKIIHVIMAYWKGCTVDN